MTLELRCGDVVPGCEGVVTGGDESEVLAQAAAHAEAAHGITEVDDDLRQALVGAIRTR